MSVQRLPSAWILLATALVACDPSPATSTGAAPVASSAAPVAITPPADPDRPDTCAPCHSAVVEEWKESMHARAHHLLDPIYAGVRNARAKKEGEEVTKGCAGCHTPRDLVDAESAKAKLGVSCASCHQVAHVDEKARGVAAFTATEGNLMLGPHDVAEDKSPAHATGAAPAHMKDGVRLCNACHGELATPGGVTMCATGIEHGEAAKGEGARTCVDCHMQEEQGPSGSAVARTTHKSHRFAGPHRAWYQQDPKLLEGAVDMSAELSPGKVTVTLKNLSQHAFPTGFPGRVAEVVVEGQVGGKVTFRSAGKVDEAKLTKIYVDAEGKPTLAPWAEKIASDTRLKAGETRSIDITVPADLEEATVKLLFRLLPPPLADKLGVANKTEGRFQVVATKVLKKS
ncbi:MAG: hypothetical protein KC731_05460 [Myxococcales bacterium]|nr:hypothetical protein [Myxococcales bacterium]